jgi:predicted flap endonuclease-1-like 5' DNA nuclease
MTSNNDGFICAAVTWGVALFAAVIAGAALMVLGSWTLLQAIWLGLIIFIALGALLSLTLCRPLNPPVRQGQAPTARSASRPEAAPAAAASSAPAAKPASAPAQKAEQPAAEASGVGEKPEALSAPRDGQPDDLKKIKGIGPKLEQQVHGLGYYHYDQIANWTEAEIAWVDDNLEGFKGRVSRDNWVEQARLLASGGETEFSKRVDKGDVY